MVYILISAVALFVSGLTFFSGFGLGTLLMPAFALFFPIETAVAATAVVHLLNNIFKFFLIGKSADIKIVIKFALPAALFAVVGAALLGYISGIDEIYSYSVGNRICSITPVKLVIGSLMIVFAVFELLPALKDLTIPVKLIPLGGALSGFFGGISGHQGALRTAFLIHAGLEKKAFIGTMVVSAVIIDISRIFVYGFSFFQEKLNISDGTVPLSLILAGTLSAFIGAYIGRQLLEKVTFKGIQLTVGVLLFLLAFAIGSGLI